MFHFFFLAFFIFQCLRSLLLAGGCAIQLLFKMCMHVRDGHNFQSKYAGAKKSLFFCDLCNYKRLLYTFFSLCVPSPPGDLLGSSHKLGHNKAAIGESVEGLRKQSTVKELADPLLDFQKKNSTNQARTCVSAPPKLKKKYPSSVFSKKKNSAPCLCPRFLNSPKNPQKLKIKNMSKNIESLPTPRTDVVFCSVFCLFYFVKNVNSAMRRSFFF